MVGQYLPQTNEKCYSVLQWLMWLFLSFFISSKHSRGVFPGLFLSAWCQAMGVSEYLFEYKSTFTPFAASLHPANSISLTHKINTSHQHQPASSTSLNKISTSHRHRPAEHSDWYQLFKKEKKHWYPFWAPKWFSLGTAGRVYRKQLLLCHCRSFPGFKSSFPTSPSYMETRACTLVSWTGPEGLYVLVPRLWFCFPQMHGFT